MSTNTPLRKAVNQILDELPDNASIEDLQYQLYVRQKVLQGLEDIAAGRVIDDEDMDQRMQSWFDESDGRRRQRTT